MLRTHSLVSLPLATSLSVALAGCVAEAPAAMSFPCLSQDDCAVGNECVDERCVARAEDGQGSGVVDDGGEDDAGALDAGLDAGERDAGAVDAGPPDAGPPDAGPPDAGPIDAGPCPGGVDEDDDGYGVGCPLGEDCDDTNPDLHTALTVAIDHDDDGYTFGPSFEVCSDGTPPSGTAPPSPSDDCDELDGATQSDCGGCFFRPFNGRAFAACLTPRWRSSAATDCYWLGMDLASLHSEAEADFVAETLAHLGLTDRVWIGLREGWPGTRWDDGSPVDFYGFPNDATSGAQSQEDCVNIVGTNTWDDDDCGGHSFPYLCATAPDEGG